MPAKTNTPYSALWKKSSKMSLVTRLGYILQNDLLISIKSDNVKILAIGVENPFDLDVLVHHFAVPRTSVTYQSNFKLHVDTAEKLGFTCIMETQKIYDLVVIAMPSNKVEAMGLISRALNNISQKGYFICDGLKNTGIKSIIKKLTFLNLAIISKAHGKLILAKKPENIPTSVMEWEKALDFRENKHKFLTKPGMFSYKNIDKGSKLLGTFLNQGIFGEVADIGSGWGYLSKIILDCNEKVKRVSLFEANHSALTASKLNIKDDRASFHWQDVLLLTGAHHKFDFVICNPPFHSNAKYDINIGKKMIKVGYRILKLTGTFWMVANKHLPYEKDLQGYFLNVDKIIENSYFKIFKATQPISISET